MMTLWDTFFAITTIIINKGEKIANIYQLAGISLTIKVTKSEWTSIFLSKKIKIIYRPTSGIVVKKGSFEDLQDMLVFLQLIK